MALLARFPIRTFVAICCLGAARLCVAQPAPNMVYDLSEAKTTSPTAAGLTTATATLRPTGEAATTSSAEMTNATASGRATLILRQVPSDRKIEVIKVIRAATGLGLKEAKQLTDAVPSTIWENADPAKAAKLKAALTEAGAVVEVE